MYSGPVRVAADALGICRRTTAGEGEALQVLAAMGVMNGDEKGNLDLSMQCDAGGLYQGSGSFHLSDMATSTAHVSPFSDVKYTHWAAGYIKTAVDAGWVNGYLDGTFRPDSPVYLEQAVNICLKMLGYTDEDFATGTYPYPQLAMYQNLKLNTG